MNDYWNNHEATEEDGGMKFYDEYADDDIRKIVDLIWEHLFIGSCWNYENVDIIRENGYKTRTFERDGFGILMAGIGKDGKWISIG